MPANRLVTASIAALLVAVIGFGGWYFLWRDDAPPPVNLDDAIASIATATPDPASVTATATTEAMPATATAIADSTTGTTSGGSSATSLTGTWTVASAGESFAGYRIGEELARVGTQTAVGRTSDVTGTLEFDGAAITAVDIQVDMTTLRSDDSRRDGQLSRRGLETSAYPTAAFTLIAPITLDAVPEEGVSIERVAIGELTLHGVTRAVEIALAGQLTGGLVVVVGSTEIQLADYAIEPPTGLSVLSVDSHGTLEFQLVFAPPN